MIHANAFDQQLNEHMLLVVFSRADVEEMLRALDEGRTGCFHRDVSHPGILRQQIVVSVAADYAASCARLKGLVDLVPGAESAERMFQGPHGPEGN